MATATAKLANRIGLASLWTSSNPTLLSGEIGVESDTRRFKIGDGSTAWTSLAYASEAATDVIWDAKGDLAVGTGANTAAKLTAGTNGHVLTADSAEATGLKWAAAAGGSGGETWDASFDGQGQVVVSGTLLFRPVASTGTIAKAALVGDVSGAVTVTVKKYTPAAGALGSSTTLGTIALATAQHNSSTPSWSVTAGDVLEFSLGGTITSVTKVFVRLST